MRVYVGWRNFDNSVEVYALGDGEPGRLNVRNDLRNHSPDGPEWGYGGSGPAQLALGILADALESEEQALELYQHFKRKVVAKLAKDVWILSVRDVLGELLTICSESGKNALWLKLRYDPAVEVSDK